MRWLVPLSSSALFWTLLIVGIHRESPRTLLSAHGFLHSAIAQRFWVDGLSLPPQNPFFAGEPLPYYWLFHAAGAGVGAAFGVDPLHAFEGLILLATIGLVAASGALAHSLYGNAALGALMSFLILVGANLQAPLVLGLRTWQSQGSTLQDGGGFLWGLAHPLLGAMRLWDPFATLGPLLPFYLNVTSRPLALTALVALLFTLHRALHGSPLALLGTAAAAAACTASSVLIGAPSIAAIAGALLLLRVLATQAPQPTPSPPIGPPLVALGVGVALGATSLGHLIGAPGTGVALTPPGVFAGRLLGVIAAGWPLLALSALSLRRANGRRRHFLSVLLLAGLALTAAATALQLPAGNHVNFFHAALVLFAACAVGWYTDARGGTHRRRAAVTVAAFTPVLLLIVAAYTQRPAIPIAFEGRQLIRRDDTPVSRLYHWIRSYTPPDAVFVIDPSPPIRAMAGNTAELPALTERTLFTARRDHYLVTGHRAARERTETAQRLLAGTPLPPAQAAAMQQLGRPVYLLVDGATQRARPEALTRRWGSAVFRSGPIAVWRWAPPER